MEQVAIPDWAYEPFEMGFAVGGSEKYAFPDGVGEPNVYAAMIHGGFGKLPKEGAVTFYKSRHSGNARVRVRFEGVNLNAADGGARNIEIVKSAREGKYVHIEYFKRSGPKGQAGTTLVLWVRGELNRKFSQLDPPNSVVVCDREDDPTTCEPQ